MVFVFSLFKGICNLGLLVIFSDVVFIMVVLFFIMLLVWIYLIILMCVLKLLCNCLVCVWVLLDSRILGMLIFKSDVRIVCVVLFVFKIMVVFVVGF